MDPALLEATLNYYNAPNDPKITQLYQELFILKSKIDNFETNITIDSIQDEINQIKDDIKKFHKANIKLQQKIQSVNEICGMVVIRDEHESYQIFEQKVKKYKQLYENALKRSEGLRSELSCKPTLTPSALAKKKISNEQQNLINEYFNVNADLDDKKQELLLARHDAEANAYALFEETKDLYNICKRLRIDVPQFDQAEAMDQILNI